MSELTDEELSDYIDDPSSIPDEATAKEVVACLGEEIEQIKIRIKSASIEAEVVDLSANTRSWLKRATLGLAVRKSALAKVEQRLYDIRQPEKAVEERAAKQKRLLIEAEVKRNNKKLEVLRTHIRKLRYYGANATSLTARQRQVPFIQENERCAGQYLRF